MFFSIQTNRENLRIMSIFPELIANSSTFNFFLVNNEVSVQNFKKGIIFPQSFWILDSVKSREWCNMIVSIFRVFLQPGIIVALVDWINFNVPDNLYTL